MRCTVARSFPEDSGGQQAGEEEEEVERPGCQSAVGRVKKQGRPVRADVRGQNAGH